MGSSTITIFPLTIIFLIYCCFIIYAVCFDSSVTLKVTWFPFLAKPIFCIMVTVLKVQHALKLVWAYKQHWVMRLWYNIMTPNQWLITSKFMHQNLEYQLPGLVITIMEIANRQLLHKDQKITWYLCHILVNNGSNICTINSLSHFMIFEQIINIPDTHHSGCWDNMDEERFELSCTQLQWILEWLLCAVVCKERHRRLYTAAKYYCILITSKISGYGCDMWFLFNICLY